MTLLSTAEVPRKWVGCELYRSKWSRNLGAKLHFGLSLLPLTQTYTLRNQQVFCKYLNFFLTGGNSLYIKLLLCSWYIPACQNYMSTFHPISEWDFKLISCYWFPVIKGILHEQRWILKPSQFSLIPNFPSANLLQVFYIFQILVIPSVYTLISTAKFSPGWITFLNDNPAPFQTSKRRTSWTDTNGSPTSVEK